MFSPACLGRRESYFREEAPGVNILFDEEQLRKLTANLKILTGLPANILDPEGQDIKLFRDHPPFCRMINDLPEGHERCVACDRCKIRHYTAEKGFQFYRCHAGVCEAIMPLYDKQNPLAYLAVGCYLDDSSIEAQWEQTRPLLDWWPDGPDALKEAFFQFRQYSHEEIQAYTETLEALSAYIQLKGMILTTEQTDAQKLALYLDEHYMEKLSLASISKHLHIGRTKLCALAKELSGRRDPVLPHCPPPHRCGQAPSAPEQQAHFRCGRGGWHQRLQLFFQGVPLHDRDNPQCISQRIAGLTGNKIVRTSMVRTIFLYSER